MSAITETAFTDASNGARATAIKVEINDHVFGSLDSTSDVDYFALNLLPGTYVLHLNKPGVNLGWGTFRRSMLITTDDIQLRTQYGYDLYINTITAGDYVVRFSSAESAPASYDFTVTAPQTPYIFESEKAAETTNDTILNATPVASGTTVIGYLPKGSIRYEDWYKATITEDGSYTFTFSKPATTDLNDIRLKVCDASGIELVNKSVWGEVGISILNHDPVASLSAIIDLRRGDYYVNVGPESNSSSQGASQYLLSISGPITNVDTLIGGSGADTFIIDNSGDQISGDTGGIDLVKATISFVLPAQIENLTLLGTADTTATGNTLANTLTGNTGANTLDGGAGNDTLAGGTGGDVFLFAASGNGIDTISDFGVGDRIRVSGTTGLGTTTAGNGFAVALGHVQFATVGDITTLYIGTDSVAGADLTIQLVGGYSGRNFVYGGGDWLFNGLSTGSVSISGSPSLGQILTAGNTLSDSDGLGSVAYAWQHSKNGLFGWSDIAGATSNSLAVAPNLLGGYVRVVAAYTDGHGVAESTESQATAIPASSEGQDVSLFAFTWKSHVLLKNVDLGGARSIGNSGSYEQASMTTTTLSLTPEHQISVDETVTTNAAVNLEDAISILKMIVGLNVNGTGRPLSPYQAIAADFDGDGKVALTDAIGVLKHVVGLNAPLPTWIFVDGSDASIAARANENPGTVEPTITASVASHIGLVGLLRGDVDASWVAPGESQSLPTDYLIDLSSQLGISTGQFGIYA